MAQSVVRGGLWVAASSYFNIAFGFIANLILTRLLAPEDFGIVALGVFFSSLIDVRARSGIGPALAQRKETTAELIGSHIVLDITAGVCTLILALLAVPLLRFSGYSWDVVWVVVAFAGIGVLGSTSSTAWILLDKEFHFQQTSLVSSISFLLSYLPALGLALYGAGYWSLIAQPAAYTLLLLVGMWRLARRHLSIWRVRWRWDQATALALVRFGLTVGLAAFAGSLVAQFDNFLVGTFVSVAVLGFYDRAYRIAQWPYLLVTSVVSRTAFYAYARLQDDPTRLRKTVTMSLWMISTFALPLAVGIFVAAPDLVAWLYGERWLPSALFLRFLVVYSVIRPLLDDANSLFVAVGKPRLTLTVTLLEATTLIVLGIPLTIALGAVGTCVAVGVTFLVGLTITYWYVIRIVALRLWDVLGLPGIAALLTLAGYLALNRAADVNVLPTFSRALGKLLLAPLAYLLILFAFKPRAMVEQARYVWRLMTSKA